MRRLTIGLLNIDRAQLTIDVLDRLAGVVATGWEAQVIVVDNGSALDELEPLTRWLGRTGAEFEQAILIASADNLGATGGRNVVLRLAGADTVLLLDNDVVLPADGAWLDALWARLEENPDAAVVGPMIVPADRPDLVESAGMALTARGRAAYLERGQPADSVPPTLAEVVASPCTCWLLRREAVESVGNFSDEFFPMQYEDVDLCISLGRAGWRVLCDRAVRLRHIGNVTTRNLVGHSYSRVAVGHAMKFREKWAEQLPSLATITNEDVYWGPLPRPEPAA